MLEIFNNRELASATLLCLFVLWAMRSKKVRGALASVIDAFKQRVIIIQLILFSVYTIGAVYLLVKLGIWNASQIKNTIMWFVFIGGVQLFNTTKINDPNLFLKSSLKSQLKLIVLVEFLVAFHSYGYIAELILVAVMSLLVCFSVVAANDPSHHVVKKAIDTLLSIIGICLVIDSVVYIVGEHEKFFSFATLRNFLVPMSLSIAILPYIYCFYYYITYESAFNKTRIYTNSKSLRRYAKVKSFIDFRGNPKLINKWLMYSCIPEFASKDSIRQSIQNFKENLNE